ncbi:MAG: serine/threonine protein kinase [Deltaproteobacteria bacterium]|nr:serine/threonine protein kinase [Deltaproteobacteria bacterium]
MIGEVLLGRYRVEELLESDVRGRVWRGVDLCGPRLVLLELWAEGTDPVRALLQGEAMAAVRHPDVLGLLDFGLHAGAHPCLVMEWAEGSDLGVRLASRKRLPWAEAFDAVARVLDALAALHDEGLVHTNLSPQALIVDAEIHGAVKVAGLRHICMATEGAAPLLEVALQTTALPYMAPELLAGTQLQPAADVFALGVVLWEAITGERPFAIAPRDITIRLGFRPNFDTAPAIPPLARRALMRMLEPSPRHREGSARACARRLRAALAVDEPSPLLCCDRVAV